MKSKSLYPLHTNAFSMHLLKRKQQQYKSIIIFFLFRITNYYYENFSFSLLIVGMIFSIIILSKLFSSKSIVNSK